MQRLHHRKLLIGGLPAPWPAAFRYQQPLQPRHTAGWIAAEVGGVPRQPGPTVVLPAKPILAPRSLRLRGVTSEQLGSRPRTPRQMPSVGRSATEVRVPSLFGNAARSPRNMTDQLIVGDLVIKSRVEQRLGVPQRCRQPRMVDSRGAAQLPTISGQFLPTPPPPTQARLRRAARTRRQSRSRPRRVPRSPLSAPGLPDTLKVAVAVILSSTGAPGLQPGAIAAKVKVTGHCYSGCVVRLPASSRVTGSSSAGTVHLDLDLAGVDAGDGPSTCRARTYASRQGIASVAGGVSRVISAPRSVKVSLGDTPSPTATGAIAMGPGLSRAVLLSGGVSGRQACQIS